MIGDRDLALVGCMDRVTRFEWMAKEHVDGDTPGAWAVARVRARIAREVDTARAATGLDVWAVLESIGEDPVTSSGFVSASAAVRFEVDGGGFWRPSNVRSLRWEDP